ncbi:MAG: exonuclease domain-containing protein [Halofilum sp. (in: g-proteobacteria)]|nr:exonuclease domain-containing protein [Halofilum sp. (in: g-proteobacteria)]
MAPGSQSTGRQLATRLILAGAGLLLAFVGSITASAAGIWLGLAGLALGLAGLVSGHAVVHRNERALEHLRNALRAATVDEELGSAPPRPPQASREMVRLHAALADFIEHRRERALETDRRLARILTALGDAIVVITANGQVGLFNREAQQLLGREQLAVGTSIFAALEQRVVTRALESARTARGPVAAELRAHDGRALPAHVTSLADGGAVISIAHEQAAEEPGCEHNLLLLDTPPAKPPVTTETPLSELPVVALDTETTGLDLNRDDIVAVGAVRVHGARVFPGINVDRLVNPARAVPPEATAIHGIDDRMLLSAPRFEEVWPELRELLDGCVLVGHSIGFDLAHLQRALHDVEPDWTPPHCLDTMLLSTALDLESGTVSSGRLELEALAARYGIEVHGRHTALGDALATAELYVHLLPLLNDIGVQTLGDATELQDTRRSLLMQQRQLGWHDAPEADA